MRNRALLALMLVGLLLTGCTPASNPPETTQPTQTTAAPTLSETTPTVDTTPATDTTPSVETTLPEDNTEDPSLVSLRQAMVETPQRFAVAYFGYALPDGNMPADPYAVMAGVAPQLCEDLPFLLQIPGENSIGTDGHLFCIVPADENATVAVNFSLWDEETETYGDETVLYRSEKGDPILLMTTNTSWKLETCVTITDSQGNVTVWYPMIDLENQVAPLVDDDGESVFFDFSPYDRLDEGQLTGGAPMDMAGTWERTWTETEGDRVESAPGGCILRIETDGMGFFWASYTDRDFPDENFTDREMLIVTGELYPGCSNNQWLALIYADGDELIHHAVTVLDDGTLLMQDSWEMDGMPMVSYGCYRKIA